MSWANWFIVTFLIWIELSFIIRLWWLRVLVIVLDWLWLCIVLLVWDKVGRILLWIVLGYLIKRLLEITILRNHRGLLRRVRLIPDVFLLRLNLFLIALDWGFYWKICSLDQFLKTSRIDLSLLSFETLFKSWHYN